MGAEVAPAGHEREGPGRDQRHEAAEPHHDLEGEMHGKHRRPVRAREGLETPDLRVGIVKGEQGQASGDLERVPRLPRRFVRPSTNPERGPGLGPELPFHGR